MSTSAVTLRNIVLSADSADLVRRKLASGEFASESDVIAEGLRGLADRDAEVERWLRTDVAATYDAVMADPERLTIPAEEVFAGLRARHAARIAKSGA
jgi:antitoxin ParD1/3/4